MDFKEVKLSDKEWIDKYLKESGYRGCEYAFGTMFIWQQVYHTEVAAAEGSLFIRSRAGKGQQYVYAFPAGNGDKKRAIQLLLKQAEKDGQKLLLRGFTAGDGEFLEKEFPGVFELESVRDEWDYVYAREDLANLSGKKYHGKRNHIARFAERENWHYEPMTVNNIPQCKDMSEAWYEAQVASGNTDVLEEKNVLQKCFDQFAELGFTGGILYLDNRVVAFTIGEPLTQDTYVVHMEKAYADIRGAYPMINQQYVLHEMEGYTYVNREEDVGIEGLRKAKESYYPCFMLEKQVAREK